MSFARMMIGVPPPLYFLSGLLVTGYQKRGGRAPGSQLNIESVSFVITDEHVVSASLV